MENLFSPQCVPSELFLHTSIVTFATGIVIFMIIVSKIGFKMKNILYVILFIIGYALFTLLTLYILNKTCESHHMAIAWIGLMIITLILSKLLF